jgi:hypothetical protein
LVGSVTIVRFCVLVPADEQVDVSSHSDRKQSHVHEQLEASTREPEEIAVQPGALQKVVEQSTSLELFSSVTDTWPGQKCPVSHGVGVHAPLTKTQ